MVAMIAPISPARRSSSVGGTRPAASRSCNGVPGTRGCARQPRVLVEHDRVGDEVAEHAAHEPA